MNQQTQSATLTPIGAVVRGLIAGTAGTAVMDTTLFADYKRGGGTSSPEDWEFSKGLTSWEQAPAPAQVGRRVVEGLFQIELPSKLVPLVNNVTHWSFGIAAGAGYGVIAGSLRRQRIIYGLPFGATVWASGYVILPAAKLYEPIWKYDVKTLAKDLGVHLAYGLGTATAMRLLSRRRA
jgi:hypothetical protein